MNDNIGAGLCSEVLGTKGLLRGWGGGGTPGLSLADLSEQQGGLKTSISEMLHAFSKPRSGQIRRDLSLPSESLF